MVAVQDCQIKTDLPDGIKTVEELESKLPDRLWRLNNLYYIRDQDGKRIKFRLNPVQLCLYYALWWLNIILKSRQHGITTFVAIYFLDECFFTSNTNAGIIAHKQKDVQKIFRDKVKYAYNSMPEVLKERNPTIKDDASELLLTNGSSIYVGVSMRSGTLQLLHISEYGWLCAHAPQKANEVKSGAMETVHEGGVIVIEATAEGIGNDFHIMCKQALKIKKSGQKLTKLDFKFHFFNWYTKDSNVLAPENVVITEDMAEYFRKIEAVTGDRLSDEQRAWYVKKKDIQRDNMFKEHPSIIDEAFIANLDGAYFGHGMVKVKEDQRVGFYPWDERVKVFTFLDIGTIHTAIWWVQFVQAEFRSIDFYYDNTGQGLANHAKMMLGKPYIYAEHWTGWDLNPKNGSNRKDAVSGNLIIDEAKELGIPLKVLPKYSFMDRIAGVRDILGVCTFNEKTCGDIGVPALFNYRQSKNDGMSNDEHIVFNKTPAPGPECHIADAFSHGALAYRFHIIVDKKRVGFPHAVPASLGDRFEDTYDDYLRS